MPYININQRLSTLIVERVVSEKVKVTGSVEKVKGRRPRSKLLGEFYTPIDLWEVRHTGVFMVSKEIMGVN